MLPCRVRGRWSPGALVAGVIANDWHVTGMNSGRNEYRSRDEFMGFTSGRDDVVEGVVKPEGVAELPDLGKVR